MIGSEDAAGRATIGVVPSAQHLHIAGALIGLCVHVVVIALFLEAGGAGDVCAFVDAERRSLTDGSQFDGCVARCGLGQGVFASGSLVVDDEAVGHVTHKAPQHVVVKSCGLLRVVFGQGYFGCGVGRGVCCSSPEVVLGAGADVAGIVGVHVDEVPFGIFEAFGDNERRLCRAGYVDCSRLGGYGLDVRAGIGKVGALQIHSKFFGVDGSINEEALGDGAVVLSVYDEVDRHVVYHVCYVCHRGDGIGVAAIGRAPAVNDQLFAAAHVDVVGFIEVEDEGAGSIAILEEDGLSGRIDEIAGLVDKLAGTDAVQEVFAGGILQQGKLIVRIVFIKRAADIIGRGNAAAVTLGDQV